ncbi:MAG: hypothetical protein KAJ29_01720 [Alphaproteobacteria bacterium]|nr:hypothetical protein [Alphaproteobacteria bacterium]
MRIFGLFLLLSLAMVGFSSQSVADKALYWDFIHHEGYKHDFDPYVGQQKIKQRSEKDMDSWSPVDWIDNPGDEKIILRDFYTMEIVKEQYMDRDNIPVLRVGEPFIRLSSFDQKRVLEFIDYVFKITESEKNGMYFVYYDGDDDAPLGVYNKSGYLNY